MLSRVGVACDDFIVDMCVKFKGGLSSKVVEEFNKFIASENP